MFSVEGNANCVWSTMASSCWVNDIKFKFDTCCVFLIRDGAAGERREVLGRELQNWQHPQIRFFTAEMEEDTTPGEGDELMMDAEL